MATESVIYTGRNQLKENQTVQPARFTWEVAEAPANTWTWTIELFDILSSSCVKSAITAYISNSVDGGINATGLSSMSGAVNGKFLYNIAAGVSVFRTGTNGKLDIEISLLSGTKYLNIEFPNGFVASIDSAMAFS